MPLVELSLNYCTMLRPFGAEVHEYLQCQQVAEHIMVVPVTWKVTKSPSYTS